MPNESSKKPFFGLDCLIMQDPKIRRLLKKKSGHKGVLAFIALLGRTYYDGRAYSLADEDFVYIVSDDLNIEEEELRLIIDTCCALNLFDAGIYKKYNILTSTRMQRQYCDNQVARRRSIIEIPEHIVLDKEYIAQSKEKLLLKQSRKNSGSQQSAENKEPNSENKEPNSENTTENAEKTDFPYISKERKGKEIKGKEKESVEKNAPTPIFSSFEDFSQRVLNVDMPMMTPEMRRNFIAYHSERTDWQRMTEDSFAARLMRWVNTEFPKQNNAGSGEQVLTYEQYYKRFGTTEPINGWQRRMNTNGVTEYYITL